MFVVYFLFTVSRIFLMHTYHRGISDNLVKFMSTSWLNIKFMTILFKIISIYQHHEYDCT